MQSNARIKWKKLCTYPSLGVGSQADDILYSITHSKETSSTSRKLRIIINCCWLLYYNIISGAMSSDPMIKCGCDSATRMQERSKPRSRNNTYTLLYWKYVYTNPDPEAINIPFCTFPVQLAVKALLNGCC
jgi:hypothetical protein